MSDSLHYACMDPGFPSVTRGFVSIDDPLPPGSEWGLVKIPKESDPRVTWRTRMPSWSCSTVAFNDWHAAALGLSTTAETAVLDKWVCMCVCVVGGWVCITGTVGT